MSSGYKAKDLSGLPTLMNPQHVNPKIDTENLVIEDDKNSKAEPPKDESMDEIYKLAKDLDIKIDGMDPETISSGSMKKPLISRLDNITSDGSSGSYSTSISSKSTKSSRSKRSRVNLFSEKEPTSVVNLASSTAYKRPPIASSKRSSRVSRSSASVPTNVNANRFVPSLNKPPLPNTVGHSSVPVRYEKSTVALTQEQQKKDHISGVLKEFRGETNNIYSMDVERTQDLKASKLEQIASLKMSLEDEGIDTSTIPNPTIHTPIKEVDDILNLLLRKNNRYRYSSLAEEVISAGAEILESFFDGNRTIPLVKWKPDYTGYSSTVNVKLHRLRFDTSQIVGNIIEKHNVSPFSRIMMELVPSLLLYPKIRQKQKSTSTVTSLSSNNSNKAFNRIRDKVTPDTSDQDWNDMSRI